MLYYAMLYKEQLFKSVFWLNLISPMEIMTGWPCFFTLRDMSQITLLLMGIYGMIPAIGLPTTLTIATIMALIATALVAITLTLGPYFTLSILH